MGLSLIGISEGPVFDLQIHNLSEISSIYIILLIYDLALGLSCGAEILCGRLNP